MPSHTLTVAITFVILQPALGRRRTRSSAHSHMVNPAEEKGFFRTFLVVI